MSFSLFPGEYLESTYSIDFEGLRSEGYCALIFDIDNTLVPHGAPADERCIRLFERLKALGFSCCLLSNNQRERVELLNKDIDVLFIENAHKPLPGNYRRAMEMMGSSLSDTVYIGDQIFTDVWGANIAGMRTILVKPIHPKEEIQIVLKRIPEKLILFFFCLRQRRHGADKSAGKGRKM